MDAGEPKKYSGYSFVRSKYSAIDTTQTTISYTEVSEEAEPFKVLITKQGVTFQGKLGRPMSNNADLSGIAKLISDCWKEHERLAPKLATSFSGH